MLPIEYNGCSKGNCIIAVVVTIDHGVHFAVFVFRLPAQVCMVSKQAILAQIPEYDSGTTTPFEVGNWLSPHRVTGVDSKGVVPGVVPAKNTKFSRNSLWI